MSSNWKKVVHKVKKGIYSTNLGFHSMVAKHRTVVNKCSRVWLFACRVILMLLLVL
jgi:hypothetical protein